MEVPLQEFQNQLYNITVQYLKELSEVQREAVTTFNGPALISAFAGELKERVENKTFLFTYYLSFSAIILWIIWLVVDYLILKEGFGHIAAYRILLSIGAVITTILMHLKKIDSTKSQFLLYIPALTFIGILVNTMPEDLLFFYTVSGILMVVISGFAFFIMPPARAIIFVIYGILTIFILQLIVKKHTLNIIMLNGGILYISMIFFTVAYTIVRFKSLTSSIKNELLVSYTNSLLQEQQSKLETKNKELQQTIIDKEILLKEIHHRVKNNLQIISSLLSLHKSNQSIDEVIKSSQNRIHAMALLYENLYTSDNFKSINASMYIERLITDFKGTYSSENIMIEVNKADLPIVMEIDKVIPLGLILNELTTNCIKHAFSNAEIGKVSINLEKKNNSTVIIVKDNGKGIPSSVNPKKPETIGFKLINGLINQINGTLVFNSNSKGTQIEITF